MGAALIMSFNKMKSKYGTHNPVVSRILQISCTECELGVMLLENWSTDIQHALVNKNQDISPIDNAAELVEVANQQTQLIKQQEAVYLGGSIQATPKSPSCSKMSNHSTTRTDSCTPI